MENYKDNKKETALEEQFVFITKDGILVNGSLIGRIVVG